MNDFFPFSSVRGGEGGGEKGPETEKGSAVRDFGGGGALGALRVKGEI